MDSLLQQFDEFRERFGVGQTRGIEDATFLYQVRQQLAEQTSSKTSEQIASEKIAAVLPNGRTCTNVYEAYEIGRESVEVLLEALRKINSMSHIASVMSAKHIAHQALSSYKPTEG